MSWKSWLHLLNDCAGSSAIISIDGTEFAHEGKWFASPDETLNIARIFKNPEEYLYKNISFGDKKYKIIIAESNFVVAYFGKENLIFQRSKKLIIGAYVYRDPLSNNSPQQISGRIYKTILDLCEINW